MASHTIEIDGVRPRSVSAEDVEMFKYPRPYSDVSDGGVLCWLVVAASGIQAKFEFLGGFRRMQDSVEGVLFILSLVPTFPYHRILCARFFHGYLDRFIGCMCGFTLFSLSDFIHMFFARSQVLTNSRVCRTLYRSLFPLGLKHDKHTKINAAFLPFEMWVSRERSVAPNFYAKAIQHLAWPIRPVQLGLYL